MDMKVKTNDKKTTLLSSTHVAGQAELVFGVVDETALEEWASGYNSLRFQPVKLAFEGELDREDTSPTQSDSSRLEIKICKSEQELAAHFSTDADVGASYSGAKVKGSASILADHKMKATSTVLLAHSQVARTKSFLPFNNLNLSDDAQQLMKSDSVSFE